MGAGVLHSRTLVGLSVNAAELIEKLQTLPPDTIIALVKDREDHHVAEEIKTHAAGVAWLCPSWRVITEEDVS